MLKSVYINSWNESKATNTIFKNKNPKISSSFIKIFKSTAIKESSCPLVFRLKAGNSVRYNGIFTFTFLMFVWVLTSSFCLIITGGWWAFSSWCNIWVWLLLHYSVLLKFSFVGLVPRFEFTVSKFILISSTDYSGCYMWAVHSWMRVETAALFQI